MPSPKTFNNQTCHNKSFNLNKSVLWKKKWFYMR